MITTNGFPKSGCHALRKAVELLGYPCMVEQLPFRSEVEDKHIFIIRDPRNLLCSWLRGSTKPVTPGMFITYFRQFNEIGDKTQPRKSLIEEMAEYEGWLTDPNTLVVRYEDLIASDACMRQIAEYLGSPYFEGAWEELPGLTITWCSKHSDYNAVWTPEVQAIWNAEGGPALLERWGY